MQTKVLTYLPSISLQQVRGVRPTHPYVVGLSVFILHPVAVRRHLTALFAVQSRLYALSVVAPSASVGAQSAFFAVPSAVALY